MTRSKMGSMGKLSQFSGIKSQSNEQPTPPEIAAPTPEQSPKTLPNSQLSPKEKPVTVNIKISRSHHEWLLSTARKVRNNNSEPVPPGDRVFPQHLIGVAIELLHNSSIDWSQVRNVEDLRQILNL